MSYPDSLIKKMNQVIEKSKGDEGRNQYLLERI